MLLVEPTVLITVSCCLDDAKFCQFFTRICFWRPELKCLAFSGAVNCPSNMFLPFTFTVLLVPIWCSMSTWVVFASWHDSGPWRRWYCPQFFFHLWFHYLHLCNLDIAPAELFSKSPLKKNCDPLVVILNTSCRQLCLLKRWVVHSVHSILDSLTAIILEPLSSYGPLSPHWFFLRYSGGGHPREIQQPHGLQESFFFLMHWRHSGFEVDHVK